MMKIPLSKPDLFAYTPHKEHMLLIDRLEDYSLEEGYARTAVDISERAVFFDDETGMVPVWVAFEYMAQTIALLAGLDSVEKGGRPCIGFIMGVRNFTAGVPGFPPGSRVSVSVKSVFRDGDVAVFEGRAELCGPPGKPGKPAASGVLNTIQADDRLLADMRGRGSVSPPRT